jgi:3-dehydroquinate dehydratase-2
MSGRIHVLHGVNLRELGRRPAEHYGTITLAQLEQQVQEWAGELGLVTSFFQTNHEGAYVEQLHELEGMAGGLILNPGAWTHYSYAIRDALELCGLPAVEVHLSDINAREAFRRTSVISDHCVATISGKGPDGYREALSVLSEELGKR